MHCILSAHILQCRKQFTFICKVLHIRGEKEYECFTGWRSHCHDCVSIGNADDRLYGFQTE